jgi:hypothetical protein
MADKYREYFDLDDAYFPQINETTIEKARWDNTYPHETFIKLLNNIHGMLDGRTRRSVWIHGSYGTGKSQCAFALKKILEVAENELTAYWAQPDKSNWPLNKQADLLKKFIGHKQRKIVTAYRYGSGGINSTQQLLLAVQESVKTALMEQGVEYTGENTLKDAVIAWIEKPAQKAFLNDLLENKYTSWPQATADEVLAALRKGGNIQQLMNNIFTLANAEGITALNLTTEGLIAWIKDIITVNDIKIVLIWDEFSAYFKNNRNSLDQFQKLAELCADRFYFVIVTHETGGLITANDSTWTIVQQRFDFSEITLPDGIAFELISHARKVKPILKNKWEEKADDINSWLPRSRPAVMEQTKIINSEIIKGLLPLHPMAALVLKYIASSFQSNQRSIFDFMSLDKDDIQAFQWFVSHTSPDDDYPLLTIDCLWNFFYESGRRENLTIDIQSILDVFPRQQNLTAKQQTVLKTVLIMQAVNQRIGNEVELFRTTDKNLSLAFEGNRDLEGNAAINIAKQLVNDGVLHKKIIGGGSEGYVAAQLVGDQSKIIRHKDDIRKNITTSALVAEGSLSDVLGLPPALKLRYELESDPTKGKLTTTTSSDFINVMNKFRNAQSTWKFKAVLAFALDDAEAVSFRKTIQAAAKNPDYGDIIIIDALSTSLGSDSLEQYIDFAAMAMYYSGNDTEESKSNGNKAKRILDTDWKNRIYNGAFIVYSEANRDGERYANISGVLSALQAAVTIKYPNVFDFAKGLSESMLKLSDAKRSALVGATQDIVKGAVVNNIESKIFTADIWKTEEYWKQQPTLSISKIKIFLENKIAKAFTHDGQISIRELYDILEVGYGFAPCNLSSFLAGFLLKEYGNEPYRYYDSINGHDSMSNDKLAEMLGNYIGNTKSNYRDTYIVKMTPEEMAFYSLTEKTWNITPNSCGTAGQAANEVRKRMRQLELPVWCLAEVDNNGIYEYVERYIELVQKEGKEAHQKAIEIGNIALNKDTLGDNLAKFISKQKCQEGMREFLARFENGDILMLAKDIGAETSLINDVQRLFAVDYSCLWNKITGENEIRKLLTEYGFVRESNKVLGANAQSLSACYNIWRDKLKIISISEEQLKRKLPLLAKLLDFFIKIPQQNEILPDQLKNFLAELSANRQSLMEFFKDEKQIFAEIYSPYLDGFNETDIGEIKSKLPMGMFVLSATECNARVKQYAEQYRQGQIKTKLFELWKETTDTKTPLEWSNRYKIPILCLINLAEFDDAKKTFETLNRNNSTDSEIKEALKFLESEPAFLSDLNDENKRKTAFVKGIIGKYSKILPNIHKVQDTLDRLSIEPYEWYRHPSVDNKVKQLAEAEYNAGGSDEALNKIDKMDDVTLKSYLKRLVKENMTVGLEIIDDGRG